GPSKLVPLVSAGPVTVAFDLVVGLVVRTGPVTVALDLVVALVVRAGAVTVELELVAQLLVRTVLGRVGAVALDLGLLVLALLVRHLLLLLEACCAWSRRCYLSRRAWEGESSHRPFKFAT